MKRFIQTWLLSGIVIYLAIVHPQPSQGHGFGKQVLKQVSAGPYMVSAWVDPSVPFADETVHVTVSVEHEAELLQSAMVTLSAQPPNENDHPINFIATHENAINNLFYEGEFRPGVAGEWQMQIQINAPPGEAETEFTLMVLGEKSGGLSRLQIGGIIVLIILGLGLLWQVVYKRKTE
jgi:hypothetical protein